MLKNSGLQMFANKLGEATKTFGKGGDKRRDSSK